MINEINGSTQQAIDRESNVIYEHLRQYANKLPFEVIQEFRNLLLLRKKTNSRVSQALETIVFTSPQQQLNTVLNNCCWVILDCWLDTPRSMSYSQLLDTFDLVTKTNSYSRHRKQLVQSIKDYQQSQSYFQLKAAIAIINLEEIKRSDLIILTERMTDSSDRHTDTIDIYLSRYTYLYHNFIPNVQTKSLTSLIERLQKERQKKFEILLSQHIIYRFRLKQLARMKLLSKKANKVITKVDNPSLLSERAFSTALKQYFSKVDGCTLSKRAHLFIAQNKFRTSYQVFKEDLYQFIITDLTSMNNTFKFENRLKAKLEDIFAESNHKPLNKSLIIQTCRQLFSFLIFSKSESNVCLKFTDLITNLGTAQTTLILTKIVLICPESKTDLENKICSLTARYQQKKACNISWLIKVLEHLLISLTIGFGNIDVSLAKSIGSEQ